MDLVNKERGGEGQCHQARDADIVREHVRGRDAALRSGKRESQGEAEGKG